MLIKKREKGSKPGDDGRCIVNSHLMFESLIFLILTGIEKELEADIVVMTTGFKQPSLNFLPEDLFPGAYEVRLIFHNTAILLFDRCLTRHVRSETEFVSANFQHGRLVCCVD